MTGVFQLPIDTAASSESTSFDRFGLHDNPFPSPTGINSGVLYAKHMAQELGRINSWIRSVDAASKNGNPVPPLAIFGSLGVGKTHILNTLEQGFRSNERTPTLRKGLADEGATRLVLADLFLRYLPFSDDQKEPGTGLLRRIIGAIQSNNKLKGEVLSTLRAGSPLRVPIQAVLSTSEPEALLWLSRWLRREYTTPLQRSKLGLGGVLESEGEAIRVVADLMRLARATDILDVWFVFIDQLEELWRPDVITPSRRARFLTDLRHLVDEAYEGAPIALLLAWNTTVDVDLYGAPEVSSQMQLDYRALWQRLDTPVNIPPLRPDDVWPFAEQYLAKVGVDGKAARAKKELYDALKAAADEVKVENSNALAPRKVLAAWRRKAEEIASKPAPRGLGRRGA